MAKWLKFLSKQYHLLLLSVTSKARLKNHLLSREEKILTSLEKESFLAETGWIQSLLEKASIDEKGKEIPWMTYPMVYLLKERLDNTMKVFEYGSGASTHFFAERVKSLVTVEHDTAWAQQLRPHLQENVRLVEIALEYGGAYSKFIQETEEAFDLIVIDGRDRVNCCKHAASALTERGVIILDNADRERYEEGIQFLQSQGFKMLKFWGMAPMSPQLTCSALFYRTNNCLSI